MRDMLFVFGYTLFFACAMAVFIKHSFDFTLRQRRKAFVLLLIGGFLMSMYVTHVYVDCDLRAGATTPCVIGWM